MQVAPLISWNLLIGYFQEWHIIIWLYYLWRRANKDKLRNNVLGFAFKSRLKAGLLVVFLMFMNLRMKLDSVKSSSNILLALMWKTLFR